MYEVKLWQLIKRKCTVSESEKEIDAAYMIFFLV